MLYAQGNNITSALLPGGPPLLHEFTPMAIASGTSDEDQVIYHDWTATLLPNTGWGEGFVRPTTGTVLGDAAGVLENGRVEVWRRPGGDLAPPDADDTKTVGGETMGDEEGPTWDDAALCELGALGWRQGT
jgi:hypothetical protein